MNDLKTIIVSTITNTSKININVCAKSITWSGTTNRNFQGKLSQAGVLL